MVTTLTYLVSSEEEVEFPGFGIHWQSTHEQRADLKNTKEFHINTVSARLVHGKQKGKKYQGP